MNINEINTKTKEGKLLLMAIAALTVSPSVNIDGKELDGRKVTPDEMLSYIENVASEVFVEGEANDFIPKNGLYPIN